MQLKTLIPFLKKNKDDIKIHFARGPYHPDEALIEFMTDKDGFRKWQEYQNRRNFNCKYVLSLIRIDKGEWLFAGIYLIKGYRELSNGFRYNTELTEYGKEYIGRLVIYYERHFRQTFPNLTTCLDDFRDVEILKKEYIKPFPGYKNVSLTWQELYCVIHNPTWKRALSKKKAVYLITDTAKGKLYVGSATGEKMLWRRWKSYVANGHGRNKELKKLNFNYIRRNFRYSILDYFSENTDNKEILKRESWWKKVLLSRERGYNDN